MDTKKIAIVVLILLALVAFMALGAGFYRDGEEGSEPPNPESYDAGAGTEAIGGVTSAFLAPFDLSRMSGCNRSGTTIPVNDSCQIRIAPGSARPSRFRLVPRQGEVFLCFALTRQKLVECVAGVGKPTLEHLEDPADFTVARDSAFLHLECRGTGQNCRVDVVRR